MVKVSIIVPIYNVEKYLHRSIESLRKQTLSDIEIILVNDGSTDGSLSICRSYEKIDSRIHVIDKVNEGVSATRNAGLENAQGEYIGFIDPDDWIEKDMYSNMYQQIKKMHADICMCNYVIDNNQKKMSMLLEGEQDFLEKQEIIDQIIPDMISSPNLNSRGKTIMGSVWRLLIERKLISQHKLRFPVEITLMEDLIFCIQAFLKCNRIAISRGEYYHYMINENSALTSYKNDIIKTQRQVYMYIEQMLKKEKVYTILEERMKVRYINMYINSIANEVHRNNSKKEREKIIAIYNLCQDNILKEKLKAINIKDYTTRKKIVLKAMKYNLAIYLYIYYSILIKVIKK